MSALLVPRSLALAVAAAMPLAAAHAQMPAQLQSVPVPMSLDAGVTRVTSHAWAYRPKQVAAPAPLIVLLHGAGGDARRFLGEFADVANGRGAILLSLQSTASSWPRTKEDAVRGADAAKLEDAIAELLTQAPIDRSRIILLGFSDGASHALSAGLANPQRFRAIVALSPGYAFAPERRDTRQRIFVAHGRRDQVLPIANTRDGIVRGLERAGYSPRTRWFAGGHGIDRAAVNEGLDYALGSGG